VDRICGTHETVEESVQGLMGKPEGKRPLGHQGVGGRMGSEWILGRLAARVKSGTSWLRTGTGGRLL
jgi:hypothetical protein